MVSAPFDWKDICDKAVAEYISKIGVDPTKHEIVNQLQSSSLSSNDVLKLLEHKANQFKHYREGSHKS